MMINSECSAASLATRTSINTQAEERLRKAEAESAICGPIHFEFSTDSTLLRRYREIYAHEFRAVHNASRYQDVLDEHDERATFLIVRRGDYCIGGARLSTKSFRRPHLLPVEMGSFRVEDHFPILGQNKLTYGQVGRICLLPEYRGGSVTQQMFWHIHNKAVELQWSMGFATAAALNARMIRKYCAALGLKKTQIFPGIVVPPYPMCEEIRMYFLQIEVQRSTLVDRLIKRK